MSPRSCARLLARLILHHPQDAPPALLRLVSVRPVSAPPPEPEPILEPGPPAKPLPGRPLSVSDVVNMVAWFYEMRPRDLRFGGAIRLYSYPRFVSWYLARTMLHDELGQPLSYSAIARRFSYDHSSVMHGINLIDTAISDDDRLRDEIEIIRLHLLGETHDHQTRSIPDSRLSNYIRYRNPR